MLQENIQFYRELIEDLPDGVLLHRRRKILFANDAAARLLGARSPAQLEGIDFLTVIHPDIRSKVVENIQYTAVDSQTGFLEQKFLKLDGGTAWVDVRITAKTIDGERGAIVVMRDAAERRQASADLRSAREQLQDAISNLADGFALWDAEDRLVICNDVFRSQYGELPIAVEPGVRFEDLIRTGFIHRVKLDPAQLEKEVRKRIAFHRSPQGRFETKVPNGPVYLTAERRTGNGGIVTIRSDITEFRRTEHALREAETRYRALFDMSPQPILVHQDGVYVGANAAAARVLKADSPDAIVGRRVADLMIAEQIARISERAEHKLDGDPHEPAELKLRRCDGEWIDVEGLVARVEIDNATAYVAHFRDVTERKRNAERLARAEKRLRDAIDSMGDAFAVWDADYRLAIFNEPFREQYLKASGRVVPGVSLDDLMRAYYLENNVCGPAECEPRIARLRRRRDDGAPFEIRLPDGRVMSMSVRPTSDGGTVMVRRDITAIRRAEEALRQREEHFRSLFELAPQGIIMHRDGVVLNANPAAAKIMKVASASDIAGQPISRFLPADEVAAAIKRGRDFIEQGTTEADIHEVKARRADGQMVILEARVAPFAQADGMAVLVNFQDVTERVQSREALRKAQEQLQDAIDSMADAFSLWGPDDRLAMFNEPFRQFCGAAKGIVAPGLSFEEMSRTYLLRNKIFAPNDVQRGIDAWLKHHARPGAPFTFELPNGDAYQIAERRTRDGGTVSICTDISEMRRAGRAIQESEEHHRLLFDAAPYGVIVVQDGAIIQANQKSARIQGYPSAKEMIGKDAFARVLPADLDALRNRARVDLAGERPAKSAHLRMVRPDGTVIHVEGAATRFEYRGRPALLIHQDDVTERVRAEESNRQLEDQLRQAEKLKSLGTLADGVAHEFNNLLVPIIGLTELAIDSLPPEDSNAEMLKQVVAAGLRSRELIKRIHAFSRAERGGRTGESIVVQDAIGATIEVVQASIPATIRLDYQGDSSCRPVAIQPDQLEQILINLCSNARDAIGDHTGEIAVRVYPTRITEVRPASRQALMPGDYVVLSVRDTGCGMDATTMERIFDPFFTTKEVGQGTGLGLAVIHGIVAARGGGTTVESAPGKGTEFCVYLPIAGAQSKSVTTPALHTEVS